MRVLVGIGLACAAIGAAGCRTAAPHTSIVQPGAPGEDSRVVGQAAASDLSHVQFTGADVRFMQGMIGHHAQAVAMVALIPSHTANEALQLVGRRIEISQNDEIRMMRRWLEFRGQQPGGHAHDRMPGMLTDDEMTQLAAARGAGFDRLFLEGMIKHHEGALTMVKELFATPEAGQEVEIFTFAADVDADQRMEIERMSAMLESMTKEQP